MTYFRPETKEGHVTGSLWRRYILASKVFQTKDYESTGAEGHKQFLKDVLALQRLHTAYMRAKEAAA